MRAMLRYVSPAVAPGNRTASSAAATKGASWSGSEYTATVAMSMARAVRITRTAISPRLATRSLCILISPSHAEDAETVPAADRRGVGGGEGHPEYVPGSARVDHPVVVQPRCHEERMGLPLDLLLDRAAPLLVGLLIEFAAGRLGG